MFSRFRFAAFVVLLMAVLSECQSSGGLSMVEEEAKTPLSCSTLSDLATVAASPGSADYMNESVVLETSSAARMHFVRERAGWYASTPEGILPVKSRDLTSIGSYLSWLSGQEGSVVRTRVHMLSGADSPTGSACVYLGRMGLFGGMPQRGALEWIPGPHMNLSSEDECREVYNIPVGYRYKGYRIKPGSVVQRASCTIRYVEADSAEEIQRLLDTQGDRTTEGYLSAEIPNVATLGRIEGGIRRARLSNQRLAQSAHFKHAALILYGKTKRNKLLRPASKIEMTLEVGLVESAQLSATQEAPYSPSQSEVQGQLQSQIKGLQSQYDAHLSAQREIQRHLSEELSAASSMRLGLSAQLKALEAANVSLHSEKETLTSQLLSLQLSSKSSVSDTASVSSLGDSSAPPAPLVSTDALPVAVEIVEESTPVVSAQDVALSESAQLIHFRKKENPILPLSAEESIQLLNMYIAEGVLNARKLSGREAIVVMGNTGAGKSTFLNYLMGCDMTEKDPEELGLVGLDDEVVVVLPRSEGGAMDEIMPIGHEKQSKTFLPHIEGDPREESPYAYCDCPGFLDNRWPEVNIANAVNIRRALQEASSVRLLILINYDTLKVDRGRGLSDMLRICTQLFGSSEQLSKHKDSVLLGITHVPGKKRMDKVRKFLLQDAPAVLTSLTERMFFYDPLDEGGEDFSTRAGCRSLIGTLKPLKDSGKLFHTVLTDSDERMLRELTERQCEELEGHLSRYDYRSASQSWQLLDRLRVIDNLSVDRLLQSSRLRVLDHITRTEMDYQRSCHFHDFVRAERILGYLTGLHSHFSSSEVELDLPDMGELRSYLDLCKERAEESKRERSERAAERARAAKDKQQLLKIIERQHEETAAQLAQLQESHVRQQAKLEEELRASQRQHAENAQRMESEYVSLIRQKAEALSLVEHLNVEEKRRLEAEKEKLVQEYQSKLESERRAYAVSEAQYKAQLSASQQQQQAGEAELSSTMAALSHQHASEASQLASLRIPEEAFGASAWREYFGVEVDREPKLPSNIETILNAKAPFKLDGETDYQRVRDNHLLVLIPAKVNGEAFSLNKLGELAKRYFPGNTEGYRYYGDQTRAQFGNASPRSSYWILLTRNVLSGSRNEGYDTQKRLVGRYSGKGYGLPSGLEAATVILMHYVKNNEERLYSDDPRTYTRCIDTQLVDGRWPIAVGGFESSGLYVDYHYSHDSDDNFNGVAGCWKL